MAKFRTKIAHNRGSEIQIYGHTIKMTPDEGQGDPGICTVEVPDERDDVFARLIEIPEGFELVRDADQPKPKKANKPETSSLVIEGDGGAKVDLYQADKATLLAIGKDLGLTLGPATSLEKIREKVIAAFKNTVQMQG
jgi:hypothetical protein